MSSLIIQTELKPTPDGAAATGIFASAVVSFSNPTDPLRLEPMRLEPMEPPAGASGAPTAALSLSDNSLMNFVRCDVDGVINGTISGDQAGAYDPMAMGCAGSVSGWFGVHTAGTSFLGGESGSLVHCI